MKKFLLPCLFFCCYGMAGMAEVIVVPVGQQASEKQSLERPRKGISKAQVEKQFGEPADWGDAVGEPPISSWEYPDFIVYFEYDHVLHSVLKRTSSEEADAPTE